MRGIVTGSLKMQKPELQMLRSGYGAVFITYIVGRIAGIPIDSTQNAGSHSMMEEAL